MPTAVHRACMHILKAAAPSCFLDDRVGAHCCITRSWGPAKGVATDFCIWLVVGFRAAQRKSYKVHYVNDFEHSRS